MEIIMGIIAAIVGVAAGAGGVFVYNKKNLQFINHFRV